MIPTRAIAHALHSNSLGSTGLARSGKDHLSSFQVSVDKWELKPEPKGDAKANHS